MKKYIYFLPVIVLLGACGPKKDIAVPPQTNTFESGGPMVSSHTAAVEETSGNFAVDARAEENAVTFENRTGQSAIFSFSAKGEWSFAPTGRFLGPNGSDEPLASEYILPRAPRFSLIVKRADATYEFIGTQAELTLNNGESVSFLMNDIVNGASDNRGSLNISWNKK
jgi:hypothetical protein